MGGNKNCGHLLLHYDDDFLAGLEDVVEADDAGGGRAERQQCDLVVDLAGAVLSVARSAGELGGEHLSCLPAPASPHVSEQPPAQNTALLDQWFLSHLNTGKLFQTLLVGKYYYQQLRETVNPPMVVQFTVSDCFTLYK